MNNWKVKYLKIPLAKASTTHKISNNKFNKICGRLVH